MMSAALNFAKRMKDFFEKDPRVSVLIILISISGGVFLYIDSYYKKQFEIESKRISFELENIRRSHEISTTVLKNGYESKIDHLKEEINSINRVVGEDGHFDVRNFFMSNRDKSKFPKSTSYFPEDRFYAQVDPSRWNYAKISELDHMKYLYGEQHPLYLLASKELSAVDSPLEIHLWRGRNEISLKWPSPIAHLYPYMTVERANNSDSAVNNNASQLTGSDPAAGALMGYLYTLEIMSQYFRNVEYNVESIQKAGDIFYINTTTTLIDLEDLDGNLHDYFISSEIFVIANRDETIIIESNIPKLEPISRGDHIYWINEWLNNFVIADR